MRWKSRDKLESRVSLGRKAIRISFPSENLLHILFYTIQYTKAFEKFRKIYDGSVQKKSGTFTCRPPYRSLRCFTLLHINTASATAVAVLVAFYLVLCNERAKALQAM